MSGAKIVATILAPGAKVAAIMAPTVRAPAHCDPEKDAQALHHHMRGLGCNKKGMIELIAHRTQDQRVHIVRAYETLYKRSFYKKLHSELGGDLRIAVLAFMRPDPAHRDAYFLDHAVQNRDERALIEIICSRTSYELVLICHAYQTDYNPDLVADVTKLTSGKLRRLLVECIKAQRPNLPVDHYRAQADANTLYKAGEGKWGTNEDEFINLFCAQNGPQFQLMCTIYEHDHKGHSIFRVISKELSGNLRRAFDALAGSLLDRPTYFATVLYEAMKGFGCHKETLTRVITSRADLDLADVARKFELKYKKSLAEMVKSEIGGKYQTFILKIMGHDNSVL